MTHSEKSLNLCMTVFILFLWFVCLLWQHVVYVLSRDATFMGQDALNTEYNENIIQSALIKGFTMYVTVLVCYAKTAPEQNLQWLWFHANTFDSREGTLSCVSK